MRQANTTFVNLRAALDDLDPLVNTAKPATKNLAPFLAELRPVLSKFVPFVRNLRLTVARPGKANDAAELLAVLPTVQERASKAFPHSEDAIAAFQPNLNFARAYVPDIFNALGKLGTAAGYYDGNGHYLRAATSAQNLFKYNAGTLEPITKGAAVRRLWRLGRSPSPLPRRRHAESRRRLQSLRRPALERQQRQLLRMQPGRRAPRTMTRRLIIAAALVAAVVVVVLLVSGGGSGSSGYLVRAVFDNGAFMVTGRAGPGRRRQRRHDRIGRRLDARADGRLPRRQAGRRARQGDHRHGHHRPGLPGFPQRRQLPDPPAVADRREVRRLPSDPAAGAGLARRRRR